VVLVLVLVLVLVPTAALAKAARRRSRPRRPSPSSWMQADGVVREERVCASLRFSPSCRSGRRLRLFCAAYDVEFDDARQRAAMLGSRRGFRRAQGAPASELMPVA
jgi:hypothetical protein